MDVITDKQTRNMTNTTDNMLIN